MNAARLRASWGLLTVACLAIGGGPGNVDNPPDGETRDAAGIDSVRDPCNAAPNAVASATPKQGLAPDTLACSAASCTTNTRRHEERRGDSAFARAPWNGCRGLRSDRPKAVQCSIRIRAAAPLRASVSSWCFRLSLQDDPGPRTHAGDGGAGNEREQNGGLRGMPLGDASQLSETSRFGLAEPPFVELSVFAPPATPYDPALRVSRRRVWTLFPVRDTLQAQGVRAGCGSFGVGRATEDRCRHAYASRGLA